MLSTHIFYLYTTENTTRCLHGYIKESSIDNNNILKYKKTPCLLSRTNSSLVHLKECMGKWCKSVCCTLSYVICWCSIVYVINCLWHMCYIPFYHHLYNSCQYYWLSRILDWFLIVHLVNMLSYMPQIFLPDGGERLCPYTWFNPL